MGVKVFLKVSLNIMSLSIKVDIFCNYSLFSEKNIFVFRQTFFPVQLQLKDHNELTELDTKRVTLKDTLLV